MVAATIAARGAEDQKLTAKRRAELAEADMMLHTGDFAYDFDSDGGAVGHQFMRNIEQVAAYVPYMVSHGTLDLGLISSIPPAATVL